MKTCSGWMGGWDSETQKLMKCLEFRYMGERDSETTKLI